MSCTTFGNVQAPVIYSGTQTKMCSGGCCCLHTALSFKEKKNKSLGLEHMAVCILNLVNIKKNISDDIVSKLFSKWQE